MNTAIGNYIDGAWTVPQDAMPNVSPSDTSDIVGHLGIGTAADVDAAVAAGLAAFRTWSHSVPADRGAILKAVSGALVAQRTDIARQLAREEGKTLPEAQAEVMRAAQIFEFYAGETVRIRGEAVQALRAGVTAEITREPLGVVGVIAPWNFPLAIPAWKIAAALAYGNCVVFKPAELVPASGCTLVRVLAEAGLPHGVVNLVLGPGSVVGQRIVEHRDVTAITFTGSVPTGRKIAAAAVGGATMKKIQLEMGGKNPLVVLDDADIDNAIETAVDGAFFATGQRCTASSRLIVTEGIHDRFVKALEERLSRIAVGHALEDGSKIGPVVDQSQLEIDLDYIAIGRAEGAKLQCGGARLNKQHEGYYLAPALFVDARPDMRICREEIFGPVAAIIRVRDYEEALAVANDTAFGLSSGICTTSLKYAAHFKRNSDAGIVKVNLPTTSVDFHLPAGGRKSSSYGPREQGSHALEFFTQTKTAYELPL